MPERGAPRDDFAPGVRILVFEQRVTIAYRVLKGQVGSFMRGETYQQHSGND